MSEGKIEIECPYCKHDLTGHDLRYKYDIENPKHTKEIKLSLSDYIERTQQKTIERHLASTVGWWIYLRIRKLIKKGRTTEAKKIGEDLGIEVCYQIPIHNTENVYIFKQKKPVWRLTFQHSNCLERFRV